MKKWMWLLPAIALWNVTPAAQAQLVPGYGPRPVGPYGPTRPGQVGRSAPTLPGQPGRYDVRNPPLAPQPGMSPLVQGIYQDAPIGRAAPWPDRNPHNRDPWGFPGWPGGYNPLPPSPFTSPPLGPQPWVPPTALDLTKRAQAGNPALSQLVGPWPNRDPFPRDPLTGLGRQGPWNMGPPVPVPRSDQVPRFANGLPSVDAKRFENRLLPPVPSIGSLSPPTLPTGPVKLPDNFLLPEPKNDSVGAFLSKFVKDYGFHGLHAIGAIFSVILLALGACFAIVRGMVRWVIKEITSLGSPTTGRSNAPKEGGGSYYGGQTAPSLEQIKARYKEALNESMSIQAGQGEKGTA